VESIDMVPTFVEAAGGTVADHILEGRAITPWLHGETPVWRDYAISEYDYSTMGAAARLDLDPKDARLFMVFDGRYKLIHAEGGFRPMLFDLDTDPEEFHDLAKGDNHQTEITRLYGYLAEWGRRVSQRITKSNADILAKRGKSGRRGILPFLYDGSEVPEELIQKYVGPVPKRPD
jgi:arylsulfatase A-like enzyme